MISGIVLLSVIDVSPSSSPTSSPTMLAPPDVTSQLDIASQQVIIIAAVVAGGGALILIGILLCIFRKKICCTARSSNNEITVVLVPVRSPTPLRPPQALLQPLHDKYELNNAPPEYPNP